MKDKNNIKLDGFDNDLIKFFAMRSPFPTWEITPIYIRFDKSMDCTWEYIQLSIASGMGYLDFTILERLSNAGINGKKAGISLRNILKKLQKEKINAEN